MERVRYFILGGSKITADGDCSHEIIRLLLLQRNAMTNLYINLYILKSLHVKKQRHYFVDKGPFSQRYGFSSSHVWHSWTIKKAEHQRTEAFELWCWRRLLVTIHLYHKITFIFFHGRFYFQQKCILIDLLR